MANIRKELIENAKYLHPDDLAQLLEQKRTNMKPNVSTKTIFDGIVFDVEERTIDLHNGQAPIVRQIVDTTDSATILLVREDLDEPKVLIEREYRSAANSFVWDLPAGRMNGVRGKDGQIKYSEDPAVTARRELAEETGYLLEPQYIKRLDKVYLSHGVLTEQSNIYVARLVEGHYEQVDRHFDADEDITDYKWVSLNSALRQTKGAASHLALTHYLVKRLGDEVVRLENQNEALEGS